MTEMLLVLLYILHASASCGVQNTKSLETSEEGLVSEKEFPWIVSLQDSHYTHLTFGSILSQFWILSIASAFQNRKDAVAIVGIAKMDGRVIAHEEYPINKIVIHEDFDNVTMTNNIALLKTDTAMHFNNLVGSICFLGRKLHLSSALRNCWVAGWNPTTAVNAFLLLEEAVCVLAVGVTWVNHSRAYLNNSGGLRFQLSHLISQDSQCLPFPWQFLHLVLFLLVLHPNWKYIGSRQPEISARL